MMFVEYGKSSLTNGSRGHEEVLASINSVALNRIFA